MISAVVNIDNPRLAVIERSFADVSIVRTVRTIRLAERCFGLGTRGVGAKKKAPGRPARQRPSTSATVPAVSSERVRPRLRPCREQFAFARFGLFQDVELILRQMFVDRRLDEARISSGAIASSSQAK